MERSGTDLLRIFPGNSEMARRMREHDWSKTPVGAPATWPEPLRVALRICTTSRFPMFLWWGASLTLFYNDAYISFLGPSKHPVIVAPPARHGPRSGRPSAR